MPLKVFLTSASDVMPPRARMSVRHGAYILKSFLPRIRGFGLASSPWNTTAIIRQELFSITRLDEHAASLARSQPVIPKHWPRFELVFRHRHRATRYEISVANPNGASRRVVATTLDGTALPEGNPRIHLLDDGATHRIQMFLC